MLLTQAVLRVIEASLNFGTEFMKNMTPDQKQAFIERHEGRMDFLQKLLGKENGDLK